MSHSHRRPTHRRHPTPAALVARLLTGLLLGPALGLAVAPTAAASTSADDEESQVETDYGQMLLVLDSSGSMAESIGRTSKIAAARKSLDTVIDDLPAEAHVGLRVFGASVLSRSDPGACTDTELVVEPDTGNRSDLRRAVRSYEPHGETPISQALQAAAKDLGGEGKRSIVLVSDGEATCKPDPCEVAREIVAGGIDLQIDVVGLDVAGEARKQLRCVAEAGQGTYYDAGDTDQLTDSLSRVSQRAARPFSFTGTPIEGSKDPVSPTDLTTGEWVDTIGADRDLEGNRYYRIKRTVPGSTIHVSAGTLGAGERWEALSISLDTDDGTSCDSSRASKSVVGNQVVGSRVTAPKSADGYSAELCRDADALLMTVERSDDDATGDATMALKVFEESPVSTTNGLPLAPERPDSIAPDVDGQPADVLGGSSYADATPVTTGRFVGTIVPGETQMFRVPLDWGQSVRTRVLLPEVSELLEQAMGSTFTPYVSVELFDPMHGQLGYIHRGSRDFAKASTFSGESLQSMTEAVRYLDRDEIGERAMLPGDYYISLAAEADDDGRTYPLPFVLEVEVVGTKDGEPDYTVAALAPDAPGSGLRSDLPALAGTAATEGEDPDETASDDPSDEPSDEPDEETGDDDDNGAADRDDDFLGDILDDPVTLTSVAAGSVGVALLLAALIAALLTRPRRRP